MQNIRFTDGSGTYAALVTSSRGNKKIYEVFGPIVGGLLSEDIVPMASGTRSVVYVNSPNRNAAMDSVASSLAASDNTASVTRTASDTIEFTSDDQKKENQNQYKVSVDTFETYTATTATTAPTKEIAVANVMKNPTVYEYVLTTSSVNIQYIRSCAAETSSFAESVMSDIEISEEDQIPDTFGKENPEFAPNTTYTVSDISSSSGKPWNINISKTVSKRFDMVVDAPNALEAQNLVIAKIQDNYEDGEICISYNSSVDNSSELETVEKESADKEDVFANKQKDDDKEEEPKSEKEKKEEEEEEKEDAEGLHELDSSIDSDLEDILNMKDDEDENEEKKSEAIDPFKV